MCRCSIVEVHSMTTAQLQSCPVQVPSPSILTNGSAFIFLQRHVMVSQPVVKCSEFVTVDLHKGISARLAEDTVMKVLRTMVQLFVDQEKALALSSFWSQDAVQ